MHVNGKMCTKYPWTCKFAQLKLYANLHSPLCWRSLVVLVAASIFVINDILPGWSSFSAARVWKTAIKFITWQCSNTFSRLACEQTCEQLRAGRSSGRCSSRGTMGMQQLLLHRCPTGTLRQRHRLRLPQRSPRRWRRRRCLRQHWRVGPQVWQR